MRVVVDRRVDLFIPLAYAWTTICLHLVAPPSHDNTYHNHYLDHTSTTQTLPLSPPPSPSRSHALSSNPPHPSRQFFSGWVAVGFIGTFLASLTVIFLPIYESLAGMRAIRRQAGMASMGHGGQQVDHDINKND